MVPVLSQWLQLSNLHMLKTVFHMRGLLQMLTELRLWLLHVGMKRARCETSLWQSDGHFDLTFKGI